MRPYNVELLRNEATDPDWYADLVARIVVWIDRTTEDVSDVIRFYFPDLTVDETYCTLSEQLNMGCDDWFSVYFHQPNGEPGSYYTANFSRA